jgi:hypothetical protein
MTLSTKILIWLGAVVLIGALGFILFKQIENSNRQKAIETSLVEQKQLIDGIVRSQSQLTTKADLEKYITDSGVNLAAIKADLEKLHAEVNAVNVVVASSNGQRANNLPNVKPPTNNPTNPNPVDPKNPDPYGYMAAQQNFQLNEDFGTIKVPLGSVGFSAWQEKPWSINILGREYQVVNVVGLDENQRAYYYNKFTVKIDDKVYDIPIKTATTKQEYPTASWSFWNPRAFLTAGGAVNLTAAPPKGSANAGLTVGVISYGQFKNAPTLSVLQVGAVYETGTQRPAVVVNPINFNIGGLFPTGLVNNTYVGPSIQLDTAGNVFTGANLSVGF